VKTTPVSAIAVLALIALTTLGGCASQAEKPEGVQTTGPRPADRSGPVVAPPDRPAYADRPWEDPSSPLYRRVMYFDYDSSEIRPEFIPTLQAHAGYLASHTATRVTLEGHTDERGTREYNLALGDQRAQTVQRYMLAEGVRADQLATLSFGEEKPVAAGHGEASWSQNRRVELAY
jgi:peptidoglycan-associated lipoprotein